MAIMAMKILVSGCKGTYSFIILLFEAVARQDMTLQINYKVVHHDSM
jgi:hypothetical protein